MLTYPGCGLKAAVPFATDSGYGFVGVGLAVENQHPTILWYLGFPGHKKR